jgi:hypothetical protein
MVDTVRIYVEAGLAVAIMATLGIIAGFVAAAITGDRGVVIATTSAVFLLAGAVLAVRLWRLTRIPALPPDAGA